MNRRSFICFVLKATGAVVGSRYLPIPQALRGLAIKKVNALTLRYEDINARVLRDFFKARPFK